MNRAERIAVYLDGLNHPHMTPALLDLAARTVLAIADSRVLLNTTQAAERYEMAQSTLYRWSRIAGGKGPLKFTKPEPAVWVGDIPLWDQDELDAYAVAHLGRRG